MCAKNLVSGDETKVITAHDVIKTVVRVGHIKQAILLPSVHNIYVSHAQTAETRPFLLLLFRHGNEAGL